MLLIQKLAHGRSLTFFGNTIKDLTHNLLALMSHRRDAYFAPFMAYLDAAPQFFPSTANHFFWSSSSTNPNHSNRSWAKRAPFTWANRTGNWAREITLWPASCIASSRLSNWLLMCRWSRDKLPSRPQHKAATNPVNTSASEWRLPRLSRVSKSGVWSSSWKKEVVLSGQAVVGMIL